MQIARVILENHDERLGKPASAGGDDAPRPGFLSRWRRLEIRPLTILCGTNGSGKSTWFRILRILQDSLQRGSLPFQLQGDIGCGEDELHDYTNPLIRPLVGYGRFLMSAQADRDFGRLGTVGLHIRSTATLALSAFDGSCGRSPDEYENRTPAALLVPDSPPHAFLSEGHSSKGTRFRVRIADPTDLAAIHEDASQLDRMVELVIDDTYSIRFERSHPSPTRHYTASCTRAFWPGCHPEDHRELVVAEFDLDVAGWPSNVQSPLGTASFDLAEWLCYTAILRIRELLTVFFYSGVYWIGAVRQIERRERVEPEVFSDPTIIFRRHVGGEGEYAQSLARRFSYNEMRLGGVQGRATVNYHFTDADSEVLLGMRRAGDSTEPSPARRIWESASEESKAGLETASSLKALGIWTARILNEALRRRDLYDPELWTDLEPWADKLVLKGVWSLSDDELAKLNRILIESAFPYKLRPHPGLVFETYYAAWLRRLLDTRLVESASLDSASPESVADDWPEDQEPPCGYLVQYLPDDERSRVLEIDDVKIDFPSGKLVDAPGQALELRRRLARFFSPPFQGGTHARGARPHELRIPSGCPDHCSSGLNESQRDPLRRESRSPPAPQATARHGRVFGSSCGNWQIHGRRNPQRSRGQKGALRRVGGGTEPRIGANLLRRMDRKSQQGWERPLASSVLEPIRINDRGQVENWPEGFMDDDVKESRRLLDAMYGCPAVDRDENEEHGA